ncbi:MAG TPA: DUF2149 domain-containing protein [Solirubrobacteraceae bacterium]|nr:DUF2149 domain-containing protein [Solirubrobacteraceae bacterium]
MRRTGLGRHSRLEDAAGDPLDGLVNLFDVGLVLAVAFLVAGLSLTRDPHNGSIERRAPTVSMPGKTTSLPSPADAPAAQGRGEEVGKVYRLSDGRLVYVQAVARVKR